MSEYRDVLYEELDDGRIVRVTLNRPEKRNAQNRSLLVELNEAMLRAEADDNVRVVILAGAGPSFSTGHELGSWDREKAQTGADLHPTYTINGGTRTGAEQKMLQEWHYFYQNTLRWRNLRKITVGQVQGPVIAAGLMLMWSCDLIVAADDTTFSDPVGASMGMCGVEYFAHPWEFGLRKTKEMMLLAKTIDADEAERLGMVSRVVARAELEERTLDFAREIAERPTVTALLIKEAVNQTQDLQGFSNALQASFTLHQLNHSHWAQIHDDRAPRAKAEDGAVVWRAPRAANTTA